LKLSLGDVIVGDAEANQGTTEAMTLAIGGPFLFTIREQANYLESIVGPEYLVRLLSRQFIA
jgi:hypothetical protein